ncbi:MAG: hypothetical protein ACE5JI_17265, partial [Acidobacteriota bacterium]
MREHEQPGSLMLGEILEQPESLLRVTQSVTSFLARRRIEAPLAPRFLSRLERVLVLGSGSSFNAGLLARDYLEAVAGIPSRAVFASEAFRGQE